MERRLVLFFVAVFVYVSLYYAFLAPPAPEEPAPPPARAPVTTPAPARPAPVPAAPSADATDAEARTVALDGPGYRATFTSRGAALADLRLPDYLTELEDGEPLPLLGAVDPDVPSFLIEDFGGRYPLDSAHWEVEETDGGWRFRYATGDGLVFTRTVTRTDRPHVFATTLAIENAGGARTGTLSLRLHGPQGVITEDTGRSFYGRPSAVAVLGDGAEPEIVRWQGGDLESGDARRVADDERLLAAGAMTSYFAAALMPEPGTPVAQVIPVAVLDHHAMAMEEARTGKPADPEDHLTNARADLLLNTVVPGPGQSVSYRFTAFAGPKDPNLAATAGYEFLVPIVESNHGNWGQWINKSLLAILRFFRGITGNWGVAIILLTVLVRGVLFPLNRVQQSSMAKHSAVMAKLKPQLDALKQKYKNNQKKFNEEQFKLMREHGAKPPLGGCLLMFLQFPIWISLFQILGTSIELRQATFFGWIDDLSRPDRMPLPLELPLVGSSLNLVPLLMAAATIVQFRFQPKPADPQQAQTQKIMGMFMPVMMLFFLYNYASGLSLYMLTSALLGIFEYHVIRRFWPVPGAPGAAGGDAPKTASKPKSRSGPAKAVAKRS